MKNRFFNYFFLRIRARFGLGLLITFKQGSYRDQKVTNTNVFKTIIFDTLFSTDFMFLDPILGIIVLCKHGKSKKVLYSGMLQVLLMRFFTFDNDFQKFI